MSKQSADQIQGRLIELEQQLDNKQLENKKLYRMVNMYKEQITQLEIKNIDLQITVESLQQVIQEGQNAKVPAEAEVEDMGNPKELN